jgi:hypothetical protein
MGGIWMGIHQLPFGFDWLPIAIVFRQLSYRQAGGIL